MFSSKIQSIVCLLAVAIAATTSIGCANLGGLSSMSLLGKKAEPAAPAVGECLVEFRGRGKPKTQTLAVTSEMRVQDVLKQSGAISKYRKLSAYILRRAPRNPNEMVKLVANYDHKQQKVSWNTDYGILPGDRIIVIEDNSTIVDQAVDALIPPLLRDAA